MISTMSMRRLILLGVGMAMAFSDVAACHCGKGKNPYNSDPCEDNVTSPPGMPYTSAPSAAPTGKPTRTTTCVPISTPTFSPTTKPTIASSKSSTRTSTLNPSATPSKSPTRSPTLKPSTAPSKSYTRSPTLKPTIAPSKSAAQLTPPKRSIAPSKLPTRSPSFSSSLTPTAPTISPSASPTATKNPAQSPAPTTTPSPTTLTAASAHPFSPTTTGAPSESKCVVSEDGFFGDTSDNVVVVTFGYELEYEQGYDESEIISGLEKTFSDFLLPLLFASQCPDERRRVLTSFRRLETVGFSKRPDDVVLQDVACAEKQDGNECVVLDGSMTIYTDDDTSANEEMIIEELKKGMENGAFVEAPIVRVSYIDLDSNPSGGKGAETTESTPKSNMFVYGIVAVVATLLLLALAVVWKRKHKNEATSTLSPDITADAADTITPNDGI